jgi:hypothetical protein
LFRSGKIRVVLSVLLATLLVAIQQFGFAHALTHLTTPASQSAPRSDPTHPAEKVCIECVAFAQLGAGLTAQPLILPAIAPDAPVVESSFRVFDPEFVPAFHSRAPPSSV